MKGRPGDEGICYSGRDGGGCGEGYPGGCECSSVSVSNRQQRPLCGGAKKPAPQQVQQIKAQHANFRRSQTATGSGSYLQPELSDSRK